MKKLARLVVCFLVIVNVFVATAFAGIPLPEAYTSIDQKSNLYYKILIIPKNP